MTRKAGVLCPLFSVPGNQGIGDLGQKTLTMIDAIANAGYKVWEILPLSPTLQGNCPYKAASSFAGDPIYINIDRLAEMGLLTQSSVVNYNKFKDFIDYEHVREFKETYFQRAFKAFRKNYSLYKAEFEAFKKEAFWLNAWTAYEVFRMSYGGEGWTRWEEEYRNWPERQEINLRDYVEKIFYVQFLQFIFYRQFDAVVQYARSRGLQLMQEMPFFVEKDSADVWSTKHAFLLNEDGSAKFSAGTPPDETFEDGQIWDRPVYDMDYLQATDYDLFRKRLRWLDRSYDIVRIVHFRAFDTFWQVPEGREARAGKWVMGPGRALLDSLQEEFPQTELVAEDQGYSRSIYAASREEEQIPGIDVLINRMETKSLKKPVARNVVLYTSCFDTPTLEEDYQTYTNNKRIALRRFFKKKGYDHRAFHDLVVHFALDQDADMAIIPIQDICGYKGSTRISMLGEGDENNWKWKLKDFKTFPAELNRTTQWLQESGRLQSEEPEEEPAA